MSRNPQLRVLNSLLFLLAVNGTAGILAVEFRYPSLWGNREVFGEYAYPLPFNWAFAHLATMIPLACTTWLSWGWPPDRLRRYRTVLLVGLIGSVVLDFVYGGGRWHRIPFVLFAVVDFGWALALSLLLTAWTRRAAIGAAVLGGILMASWPSLSAYLEEKERAEAFARISSKDGRVRARAMTAAGDVITYTVEVAGTPKDALSSSACLDVLRVYEDMLAFHEPKDADPRVEIVRPREENPFARAEFSSRGRWQCLLTDTRAVEP